MLRDELGQHHSSISISWPGFKAWRVEGQLGLAWLEGQLGLLHGWVFYVTKDRIWGVLPMHFQGDIQIFTTSPKCVCLAERLGCGLQKHNAFSSYLAFTFFFYFFCWPLISHNIQIETKTSQQITHTAQWLKCSLHWHASGPASILVTVVPDGYSSKKTTFI